MPMIWRVSIFLEAPVLAEVLEPGNNPDSMPKKLNLKRTVIDDNFLFRVSDDIVFLVTPFVSENEFSVARNGTPIKAILDLACEGENSGLISFCEPYIEELIDYLSFIWTFSVSVYKIEAVNITEPVNVKDKRDFILTGGYSAPKLRPGYLPTATFEMHEPKDYDTIDDDTKVALRWYSLAMQHQSVSQQFMALWIAMEKIIKSSFDSVILPYKAPCGHEIKNCPECSKETKRNVGGSQIKKFFIEECDLDAKLADKLWRLRQMFHGANKLSREDIETMIPMTSILGSVVQKTIGERLAKAYKAIEVAPAIPDYGIIHGQRSITTEDLSDPERNFSSPTGPLIRLAAPLRG